MPSRDRVRREYRDTRIREVWALNEQRVKFDALFETKVDAKVEAKRECRLVIAQSGGTRLARRS